MSIHVSVGTPTADSYISVASADNYFSQQVNNVEKWTELSLNTSATAAEEIKENFLKLATLELDTNLKFQESKYNNYLLNDPDYQALQFPRSSNTDANGDLYIPIEVQRATCEQALWILERSGTRTMLDGSVKNPTVIGDRTYNFIRPWITRKVEVIGKQPWRGSDF